MYVSTPPAAPTGNLTAAALAALRAALPGGVHRPGEAGYDAAITGFSDS